MMDRQEEIFKGLYENTIIGKADPVKELTNEALSLNIAPDHLLWQALIPALEEVGRRFERGEYFVPEMLIAARAMQGAMDILKPLMIDAGTKPIGTFVMCTVKGDVHDIGKNLCNIMLEGAGFKIVDLGVNTSPDKIVKAVEENQPDLVGFSAFLTTTMPMFKVNIEALQKAGLRDKVKVLAGGAPVTPEYALKSGADAYAKDASEIVRVAKKLIGIEGESAANNALSAAVKAMQDMASKAPDHDNS